jgi:hypothetical protein
MAILEAALGHTDISSYMTASSLNSTIWDSRSPDGLYRLFQHAVHLVTVERPEIATDLENFNFVFKSPRDDDIYHGLYAKLPQVLLFAVHVIRELFNRMVPMDRGSARGLTMRSAYAWFIILGGEPRRMAVTTLNNVIAPYYTCEVCGAAGRFTAHNAAGVLMCETYRCNGCRHESIFPFSWLLGEMFSDEVAPASDDGG